MPLRSKRLSPRGSLNCPSILSGNLLWHRTLTAVRTSIMNVCFLLQNSSGKERAEIFQMHLLVEHVDV
jgi:hypothetical protein